MPPSTWDKKKLIIPNIDNAVPLVYDSMGAL